MILGDDVKDIGNGKFKGIIYGFEPSYSTEYKDLKIDQLYNDIQYGKIILRKKSNLANKNF